MPVVGQSACASFWAQLHSHCQLTPRAPWQSPHSIVQVHQTRHGSQLFPTLTLAPQVQSGVVSRLGHRLGAVQQLHLVDDAVLRRRRMLVCLHTSWI